MTLPYTPPELTKAEQIQAVKSATKVHNLHDLKKRVYYITALFLENMRLVKQVNDLRDMLGMPQIKTFDADESRIG